MRYLLFVSCVVFVLSLVLAAPVEAKGGKGGGGGGGHGRPSFGGGHGGGGGPKWSGQQPGHGGQNKQFEHGPNQGQGNGQHQFADEKHEGDDDWANRSKQTNNPANNFAGNATDVYNKKQQQLLLAQQHRDKLLAQSQHLRDIAARNGNMNLLANANRMEADALSQYANRVAQLEKFGVTDPALNPGGVTNPLLPGGVSNPVVSGGVANPLLPGGVQPLPGGGPAEIIRDLDSLNLVPFRP